MEVKELMINDWAYFPIMLLTAPPRRKTGQITVELMSNPKALREIEPIPLTEDVLKANGFEMRGVQFAEKDVNFTFDFGSGISKGVAHIQVFVDKTHRLNIKLPQRYNNGSVGLDLVCYVHELQHALRLCGLAELADNFKVE